MNSIAPWHGSCCLQFHKAASRTQYQGGCISPLKLLRAEHGNDGRCEIPIIHTAGGLVGGDQLNLDLTLNNESRSLITSVAAQKVYGTVGRSRINPKGLWTNQKVLCNLQNNSDLEWLPQEIILYANALFEQKMTVKLTFNSSFLGAEIVRLGRTASKETLQEGCFRSGISLQRIDKTTTKWELVDRLEFQGDSLQDNHGLACEPVFGSLIWAAPRYIKHADIKTLIEECREDRTGLEGNMRCGALDNGLVARYTGRSSREARFWFCRIWERTRLLRGLTKPRIPRVWPLGELPLDRKMFTKNLLESKAETQWNC